MHQNSGLLKKQTQFATQPDKYNRVHYFVLKKIDKKNGLQIRDVIYKKKKIVNQLLEFENVASVWIPKIRK